MVLIATTRTIFAFWARFWRDAQAPSRWLSPLLHDWRRFNTNPAISIAAGSVLLTVSLVLHAPGGTRAAGYAVIAGIGVLVASSWVRISEHRQDRLAYGIAFRNTQYGRDKVREDLIYKQLSMFLDQHHVHGASLATLRASVDEFDAFPIRERAVRLICCSKAYRRRGKGAAWHPQHEPDIAAAAEFINRSKQWAPIVELMNGRFEYGPRWMQMCLLRMMYDAVCTDPGWQLARLLRASDGPHVPRDEDLSALEFLRLKEIVDPLDYLPELRKKVALFDQLALDEQARRLICLRRAHSDAVDLHADDVVPEPQLRDAVRYIGLWNEWGQSATDMPKAARIETLPQRARRLRLLRAAYHRMYVAPSHMPSAPGEPVAQPGRAPLRILPVNAWAFANDPSDVALERWIDAQDTESTTRLISENPVAR